MRVKKSTILGPQLCGFPFLFGGTFIEGPFVVLGLLKDSYFPSFSEGLSLRGPRRPAQPHHGLQDFPSFSEGLSLRAYQKVLPGPGLVISLPFRRDFH